MKSSHSILIKETVMTCMLVVHFVAGFIREARNSYLKLAEKKILYFKNLSQQPGAF